MNGRKSALWRRGIVAAAAAMVAVTGGVAGTTAVHATTGGHQIHFVLDRWCAGEAPLRTVTITGRNQTGRVVTWSGSSTDTTSTLTSRWWWVGDLRISYTTPTGQHWALAYAPAGDDSRYAAKGEPDVEVDCFGTRKWMEAVVTSDEWSNWCISEDNPSGHYTLYTHYLGYVFVGPRESLQGYAIGPNGRIVPKEIVRQFGVPDCG